MEFKWTFCITKWKELKWRVILQVSLIGVWHRIKLLKNIWVQNEDGTKNVDQLLPFFRFQEDAFACRMRKLRICWVEVLPDVYADEVRIHNRPHIVQQVETTPRSVSGGNLFDSFTDVFNVLLQLSYFLQVEADVFFTSSDSQVEFVVVGQQRDFDIRVQEYGVETVFLVCFSFFCSWFIRRYDEFSELGSLESSFRFSLCLRLGLGLGLGLGLAFPPWPRTSSWNWYHGMCLWLCSRMCFGLCSGLCSSLCSGLSHIWLHHLWLCPLCLLHDRLNLYHGLSYCSLLSILLRQLL